MSRTSPRLLLPLAALLALGACATGQHADTQLSQMYKCDGADPNGGYSICDKKTHGPPFVPPHHTMVSDMRAKEDIRLVGRTFDGLNVYTFRYKGDDVTQMGVMAQEVQKIHPDAVVPLADGYLSVDYSRIGTAPAP
jgi:hypothetical protein